MFELQSKLTHQIVLAVASAVAVADNHVVSWFNGKSVVYTQFVTVQAFQLVSWFNGKSVVYTPFVTVQAFQFISQTIVLVTVKSNKVPTLVKLEPNIVDFKLVQESVVASAVTVIFALQSNDTQLIVLGVANVTAVVAVQDVHIVLSPVLVQLLIQVISVVNASVPVVVGRVKVHVFDIDDIIGAVNVLFVNVCVHVNVTSQTLVV